MANRPRSSWRGLVVFVVVLTLCLVAYAVASGLYNDVVSPFRPPNP